MLRAAGLLVNKRLGRKALRHTRHPLFRKTRCNPGTAPSTAPEGGKPTAYPQLVQNLVLQQARELGPGNPQGYEAPRHIQTLKQKDVLYASQRSLLQSFRVAAKMPSVDRSGYHNYNRNNHNISTNNNEGL